MSLTIILQGGPFHGEIFGTGPAFPPIWTIFLCRAKTKWIQNYAAMPDLSMQSMTMHETTVDYHVSMPPKFIGTARVYTFGRVENG